jgi:tRNA (guanine-N7-)-methyltransferase
LKTDSPDLYAFTKMVIAMYGCVLHADLNDVYNEDELMDDLKIKTHYEELDIAKSNRVHYLCFSLPAQIPGTDRDEALKQILKSHEGTD